MGGSDRGDGIGENGDWEEVGSGVSGEMLCGGRLRGGWLVEAFSEGMDGDAASLAEFGLGQAATAEIVEEGVPAEVEDVAPKHGVISRTGLRPHCGNDRRFSGRLPDAVHRTDSAAVLLSLCMTCKHLGIDPQEYLRDVLDRISTHPASRIDELLPDRWQALRRSGAAAGD